MLGFSALLPKGSHDVEHDPHKTMGMFLNIKGRRAAGDLCLFHLKNILRVKAACHLRVLDYLSSTALSDQ